jgi:hypothetical protein
VRPDGTRVVSYRNGTVKEVHADGEVRILFSNGDVKQQMPVHSCGAAQRLVVDESRQLAASSRALGGAALGGAGLSPLLTADIPAAVLASLKLGDDSNNSTNASSGSGSKDGAVAAAALFATLCSPNHTTNNTTSTSIESVVVYWYGQARTRHTTFPSGIEVYEFPNGQVMNAASYAMMIILDLMSIQIVLCCVALSHRWNTTAPMARNLFASRTALLRQYLHRGCRCVFTYIYKTIVI